MTGPPNHAELALGIRLSRLVLPLREGQVIKVRLGNLVSHGTRIDDATWLTLLELFEQEMS